MSVQIFQASDGSLVMSAETAAKFERGNEVSIHFPVPGYHRPGEAPQITFVLIRTE